MLNSRNILLPSFLCISNGLSSAKENIALGNEKVLKARFSDATFFIKSDLLINSSLRINKLKNVTFSELKGTLEYFAKEFFGSNVKTRFRPSYFPFTEPSAEMDVYWGLNSESDYRITKGTGWLEILGCGMVDPEVFKSVEYDSDKYSGFAFGLGVERFAMLKYGITDLRMLYENDHRWLKHNSFRPTGFPNTLKGS